LKNIYKSKNGKSPKKKNINKQDLWMEEAIHAHTYLIYLRKVFFNSKTEKKFLY
jgi:hypothetical protein